MLRSRIVHALVVITLLAAPLFLFSQRALAIQDSEDKVWFGPVGITPGERAVVNIYVGNPDIIGNPDEIGNPNETPWDFVVRVFDSRGKVVHQQKLQLAAGVIGSVVLAVQDEVNTPGIRLSRQTFRAEIVGFNPQPDPPGKWAATLEVVDRLTGRTSLLLGGPDTLPAATSAASAGQ
jgi:hypothetical protein